MKAKTKEKYAARKLRRDGLSIPDISIELAVSKSSVSAWVRDIELTHVQKKQLNEKSRSGWREKWREQHRNKRRYY